MSTLVSCAMMAELTTMLVWGEADSWAQEIVY